MEQLGKRGNVPPAGQQGQGMPHIPRSRGPLWIQRGSCLQMLPELSDPAPFPAFRENQAAEGNLDGIGKRREVRPQSPSSADPLPRFASLHPRSSSGLHPLGPSPPLAFLYPSLYLYTVFPSVSPLFPVFLFTGSLRVQQSHKNDFTSVARALMLFHPSSHQDYSGEGRTKAAESAESKHHWE